MLKLWCRITKSLILIIEYSTTTFNNRLLHIGPTTTKHTPDPQTLQQHQTERLHKHLALPNTLTHSHHHTANPSYINPQYNSPNNTSNNTNYKQTHLTDLAQWTTTDNHLHLNPDNKSNTFHIRFTRTQEKLNLQINNDYQSLITRISKSSGGWSPAGLRRLHPPGYRAQWNIMPKEHFSSTVTLNDNHIFVCKSGALLTHHLPRHSSRVLRRRSNAFGNASGGSNASSNASGGSNASSNASGGSNASSNASGGSTTFAFEHKVVYQELP